MTQKDEEIKRIMMELAKRLGFDDVRFYKSPLPEAGNTAVLLFKGYIPSGEKAEAGKIALSPYYPCSHTAYMGTKELVRELNETYQIKAERSNVLHYKGLAVSESGRIGLNSLYYHDQMGSFLSMQCLVFDLNEPPETYPAHDASCQKCGACIAACPTGAITQNGWEREKCLRHLFNAGLPDYARAHVYELLGCERCQLCCPMNSEERRPPTVFDLKEVIEGRLTKTLKAVAGTNMATRTKLLTQAMCYAAANGRTECLDAVSALTQDDSVLIKEIAVWAAGVLKNAAHTGGK